MSIDFGQVITAEAKAAAEWAASVEAVRVAVDQHVEATAKAKSYNSAAHCASYVLSTVEAWALEAEAFIAWRDNVWLTVFAGMADPPEVLDAAAIVAALPEIVWP